MNSTRLQGRKQACILPASRRCISKSWLTRRSNRRQFRRAITDCSSGSDWAFSIADSNGPMVRVRGVRNSWERFWKNSVFWRSSSRSCCACWRVFWKRLACCTAIAAWAATACTKDTSSGCHCRGRLFWRIEILPIILPSDSSGTMSSDRAMERNGKSVIFHSGFSCKSEMATGCLVSIKAWKTGLTEIFAIDCGNKGSFGFDRSWTTSLGSSKCKPTQRK